MTKQTESEGKRVKDMTGEEAFRLLASAMRKVLPPELLRQVIEHCDPLGAFLKELRK